MVDKKLRNKIKKNETDSLKIIDDVLEKGYPNESDRQEFERLLKERDQLSHEAFKNA